MNFLLVLLLIPTVVLIVDQTVSVRKNSFESTTDKAAYIAQQLALENERLILSTHTFLKALSDTDYLQNPAEAECSDFLRQVSHLNERYRFIAAVTSDGYAPCFSLAHERSSVLYVGDTEYFQRDIRYSLDNRAFSVTAAVRGKVLEKPAMIFSYPITSRFSNDVIGVVAAAIPQDGWHEGLD
ncbi:MAG: hypothetical protein ACWA5K_08000, partial [bacterium]